jgi:hypothetical protein
MVFLIIKFCVVTVEARGGVVAIAAIAYSFLSPP